MIIAEYLASSWPFILPPAMFVAGIAVGVKCHRAHAREVQRNTHNLRRSAEAYARESKPAADAYTREMKRHEG